MFAAMKKFLLAILFVPVTHFSIAQLNESSTDRNDSLVAARLLSLEQRVNITEQEIDSLRKQNRLLKYQLEDLQLSQPSRQPKRKITVSRRGSKQVTVE